MSTSVLLRLWRLSMQRESRPYLSLGLQKEVWNRSAGASFMSRSAGLAVSAALLACASTCEPEESGHASLKTKIINNYENRIRKFSSPEKVFETFASVSKSGEWFMTPGDFMRSITPNTRLFGKGVGGTGREYAATKQAAEGEGHTKEAVPSFFQLFDTDGDGLISFPEYLFFITLLAIPDSQMQIAFKMFDLDGSGEVDREEFKTMMGVMRSRTAQGQQQRSEGVEEGGVVALFFGEDGNGRLGFEEFRQFMSDLRKEVVRLEFDHFDVKNKGYLLPHEFAEAIVASADVRLDDYLGKIEAMRGNRQGKISFQEFYTYYEFLKQLDAVQLAMETYTASKHTFTRESLVLVARAVADLHLSPTMVDVIFEVFDIDGDGSLQYNEFLQVMRKANSNEIIHGARDVGFTRFFNCVINCAKRS